jgi:hypothetical protein
MAIPSRSFFGTEQDDELLNPLGPTGDATTAFAGGGAGRLADGRRAVKPRASVKRSIPAGDRWLAESIDRSSEARHGNPQKHRHQHAG